MNRERKKLYLIARAFARGWWRNVGSVTFSLAEGKTFEVQNVFMSSGRHIGRRLSVKCYAKEYTESFKDAWIRTSTGVEFKEA